MKKINRPSWDEYFLSIAKLVSRRSTCLRRSVGAILVKDKRILATGYNGAPSNIQHCEKTGCLREKLRIPSGERHELCLPPDEEVLTKEGFIPISNIKEGQRVFTHKGFFRPVMCTFKRKYKGKLLCIEPYNFLPIRLTPEHPVLAIRTQKCQFDKRTLCKEICKSVNKKYCNKPYLEYKSEWIPASKLKKRDLVLSIFENRNHIVDWLDFSFIVNAPLEYGQALQQKRRDNTYKEIQSKLKIWPSTAYNWVKGGAPRGCTILCENVLKHGSSPSKTIPAKIKLTDEILRLIGLYLAEGCSSSNQLSFSFHKKEKNLINEVKKTMRKTFDLEPYEDIRRNSHKLVYSSIILAKVFKELFGRDAYTKKIPNSLMRLSPRKQRYIIDAYAQGDGHKINKDTTSTVTASKNLALQEVQILLRLGYLPVIDKGRNVYRVIWKDNIKISYGYLKKNILFTPIRKIWSCDYSGYVYNLEVERDNSFVTKSFIVHNCRGLHAEQNALLQAALHGVSAEGSKMYITNQPCIICAKMLINAGIKEVIMSAHYPDKMAKDFLKEAGIKMKVVKS